MLNPTLFIDDVSEVRLPLSRRGVNITTATVSFGVWTARTGGTQIGSDHSMPWDSTVNEYVGLFPVADAAGLTETVSGGPFYWVRITATGYTTRYIKCRAQYRGIE